MVRPFLGLDPTTLNPDLVVHCAASLEFDAPEEELRAVNVEGTRHALDLARATGAAFLHVSTAYDCGLANGTIAEGPVATGTRFANRYEASKAAAEQLVRASGLHFAIARPSITLGDSATGQIREFPSLCNVFRLMARGKISQFPAAGHSTLDMVPIDHVAEGLAMIAERMGQARGGTFHLVADTPLPSAELAHAINRVAHFPRASVISPEAYDPAHLPASERRVSERMLATFGSYFRHDPRFSDRSFQDLTQLACPPTDSAWLDRLIAHGIARGYLPAVPSAHRDSGVPAARALPQPTSSLP